MQEIKIYKAVDGTIFDTREKCKDYENNCETKIKEDFKKLICKTIELSSVTDYGSIPFTEAGEDWYMAVIEIKNSSDLEIAQKFHKLTFESRGYDYDKASKKFEFKQIGEKVIVGIGDSLEKEELCWCYPYGTVDECIKEYTDALINGFK